MGSGRLSIMKDDRVNYSEDGDHDDDVMFVTNNAPDVLKSEIQLGEEHSTEIKKHQGEQKPVVEKHEEPEIQTLDILELEKEQKPDIEKLGMQKQEEERNPVMQEKERKLEIQDQMERKQDIKNLEMRVEQILNKQNRKHEKKRKPVKPNEGGKRKYDEEQKMQPRRS